MEWERISAHAQTAPPFADARAPRPFATPTARIRAVVAVISHSTGLSILPKLFSLLSTIPVRPHTAVKTSLSRRPRHHGPFGFLFVALAFVAALDAAERLGASPTVSPRPLAPAIENTLTNGLRYVIQPHGSGLGRVSVRLVVAAGSLDERDDELGYAHFVEHMAFNGSRHFPPGKVIEFFQRLGLGHGADLWAGTSFSHTIYKIDLPAGRAAELGEALKVLRDFADGIEFGADEVEREKGVVLSERAARDTAGGRVAQDGLSALYEGTRLPERFPIGTQETISRATATALRAFYTRCYQPRRMTLVVAGDVAAATARSELERHFASLAATPTAAPPVTLDLPPARQLRTHAVARPHSPAATARFFVLARDEAATPIARHATVAGHVVIALLDYRLAERRARERDRFGDADASAQPGPLPYLREHHLSASTAARHWPAAIRLLEEELRRAREHGFGDDEVRERVAAYLAQRRADRDAVTGQTPDLLAERMVATLMAGRPWRAPAAVVTEQEAYLAGFTPAAAQAVMRSLFAEERLHVLLEAPAIPDGGRTAVAAAYRESASRPLEPAPAFPTTELAFRYIDFGLPGAVTARHDAPDLGVNGVHFGNGVRFNTRASVTEPGRFQLSARFGRGATDQPRDRPGLGHLASHLLGESDLGRHSREELRRLLALRAVKLHAGYDHQLHVEMSGPAHEVTFALQLLTALVTDLRLDAGRLPAAFSDYAACIGRRLEAGGGRAGYELMLHMSASDPRLCEPPLAESQAYPYAELSSWIHEHCRDAALEVGLVGDFDPATVVAAAAASVGTLPARREHRATGPAFALRGEPAHEVRPGPATDAVAHVMLAWPAPRIDDLRRRWALRLATDIVEDRLQRTLREELGATYSPDGGVVHDFRHPAFGFAVMGLTFDPARATELARRAIDLAADVARDGATAEEFARLHAPLGAAAAESQRSNAWWVARLACAQSSAASLEEPRRLITTLAGLTREEINRSAAEHFPAAKASSIIVRPERAAARDVASHPAAAANEQGERKFRAGDRTGAAADFSRAIAHDPTFALAHTNRGAVRLTEGDTTGAIADSTRAIELDASLAAAYLNRSAARIAHGDFDGARADATEAIRLDPESSRAHNNRGLARRQQNDHAGAFSDWTRAIELDPGNALAFTNRARARLTLNDVPGALRDAATAIELEAGLADAYVIAGHARHMTGQVDAALADFTKAIALNPSQPDAHRNRGIIRLNRGDAAGALADFDAALGVNPRDADAHANRGLVHHSRKDYDRAVAEFDAAVALQPERAILYSLRAGARQTKGDYAGAITDCDRALALDPRLAEAYNNRGYARQQQGDLDGAITDFTAAIALNPAQAVSYANRGNARKAKGDRLGAIDDLDQAHRLSPPRTPGGAPMAPSPPAPAIAPRPIPAPTAEALALLRSGTAKRLKRDYPGALADLDRALERNPAMAEAYLARGSIRALRNDPAGALADHTRAIELKPDLATAYVERGNLHRTQQRVDLAIADYDRAIALQPKLVSAHYNRGLAHEARSDRVAALRDFDAALALNPNYAPAYNGRGLTRQARGNLNGALADFSEAIRRSMDYTPAYFNRGATQRMRGDLTAALADYDKLLELAPTYPNAHLNRAHVRQALGQFEGALADYDRAIELARTGTQYGQLFRALVQRRLQRKDAGAELSRRLGTWSASWSMTIGRFLTGAMNEEEFLVESRANPALPASRRCEAHYFAGMMRLLRADPVGARDHFQQSVAANQRRLPAHQLAAAELARLQAADGNTKRP